MQISAVRGLVSYFPLLVRRTHRDSLRQKQETDSVLVSSALLMSHVGLWSVSFRPVGLWPARRHVCTPRDCSVTTDTRSRNTATLKSLLKTKTKSLFYCCVLFSALFSCGAATHDIFLFKALCQVPKVAPCSPPGPQYIIIQTPAWIILKWKRAHIMVLSVF